MNMARQRERLIAQDIFMGSDIFHRFVVLLADVGTQHSQYILNRQSCDSHRTFVRSVRLLHLVRHGVKIMFTIMGCVAVVHRDAILGSTTPIIKI